MAIRLKTWVAVVLALCGFVWVWGGPRPDRRAPTPRTESNTSEMDRLSEIRGKLSATRTAAERLEWSDSLSALAMATNTGGVAVGVAVDRWAGVDPATTQRHLVELRAGLDRQDPRMVYGHFVVESDYVVGSRFRPQTFVGVRNGTPYCLSLLVFRERSPDEPPRAPPPLDAATFGRCTTFLRHGLPGAGMDEWLARGAADFLSDGRSAPQLPEVPATRSLGIGRLFTSNNWNSPEGIFCQAGNPESCERVLVGETWTRPVDQLSAELASFVPALGSSWRSPPLRHFLTAVEAEFGYDRFHRFWTSDDDVLNAFADAFGIGLGDWVVSWLERNEEWVAGTLVTQRLYRGGPGVNWVTWLTATLFCVLGATVAVSFWRRQEV